MPRCVRALAVVMVCYVMALPATATTDASANAISDICLRAGQTAARRAGVPEPVLLAITLTETGRVMNGRHRPWPWTVNMEGVGKWFDTREEALAYVRAHHARGARSYDVGCFQINYRWHGQAFASIEAMFDPTSTPPMPRVISAASMAKRAPGPRPRADTIRQHRNSQPAIAPGSTGSWPG